MKWVYGEGEDAWVDEDVALAVLRKSDKMGGKSACVGLLPPGVIQARLFLMGKSTDLGDLIEPCARRTLLRVSDSDPRPAINIRIKK